LNWEVESEAFLRAPGALPTTDSITRILSANHPGGNLADLGKAVYLSAWAGLSSTNQMTARFLAGSMPAPQIQ
jgi:hypothetical protein